MLHCAVDSVVYVCIFGFKGMSTSKVIGAHNEMMMDDYDGQMIFRELVGLKLPDIRLTGVEKPRKNLTQDICPDRMIEPGPAAVDSVHNDHAVCIFCHIMYYSSF